MEGDLDLQEILKSILIPKIRTPKKKVVVVKDKYEEGEKLKKLGGWWNSVGGRKLTRNYHQKSLNRNCY